MGFGEPAAPEQDIRPGKLNIGVIRRQDDSSVYRSLCSIEIVERRLDGGKPAKQVSIIRVFRQKPAQDTFGPFKIARDICLLHGFALDHRSLSICLRR